MTRHLRAAVLGLALTLSTAGLAACSGGGSSVGGSSGAAASSSASKTGSASGSASATAASGRRGIFGGAQVQACLKAAGITVPTGGRAGGLPSGSRPSGSFPSGARPTGSRPSFSRPSGAGGGFGGDSAESQKIQAALKACGITLPTGRRGAPGASATPSAAPTS